MINKDKKSEYGRKYYKKNKKNICDLQRKYYRNNKDSIKKKVKEYQQNNKDKIKTIRRKYYINNKEEIKDKRLKYYRNNKEKIKKSDKKYYQQNKDKIKKNKREKYKLSKHPITEKQRAYNKKYFRDKYSNDIQFKLRVRMCNRFNGAIKRYYNNNKIPVSRNININYKAIIEHLTPFPTDLENYEIDHIIPLNFFNLRRHAHIKMAWNPINIRWLRKSENSAKGSDIDFNKYPIQEMVFNHMGLKPKGL